MDTKINSFDQLSVSVKQNQDNDNIRDKKGPKKRVLFIITLLEGGGAQRFLYNFISHLNQEKYKILLAAGTDGYNKFLHKLEGIGIPTQDLYFLKRDISFYRDYRAIDEIKKLIKDFNPDVLFLNSSKAGALGSMAGKAFPMLKIIYRIGGWSFNDPVPWYRRFIYILVEKYTAKYKDIIIVNNKHDFDQAKKLKINPRKALKLIHNGIDLKKIKFIEQSKARLEIIRKISGQGGNVFKAKYIIGTIANLYKTKGLEYLLEAIKRLPNDLPVISVIIGDGNERNYLKKIIKEKGIKNKVFLTGSLDNAWKYLKAFDLFILPSVKEGFPWTILEAMAAKLPIIATNVGAIPEIIKSGKNGFMIKSKDPEAIKKAIEEILSNYKLQQELGIQAHQTVLFKYDLDRMVKKIEELF